MKRNRFTPNPKDVSLLEVTPKSKKAGSRVPLLDSGFGRSRKPAGLHREPGLALCRIRHILERKETADKPLVWLREEDKAEIKTPPLSARARLEAGYLLRRLQRGEVLSMPESRPMPAIGARCHELRINDEEGTWRIFYRTDPDAIVLLDVLQKKTRETPGHVIETCRRRLAEYDRLR